MAKNGSEIPGTAKPVINGVIMARFRWPRAYLHSNAQCAAAFPLRGDLPELNLSNLEIHSGSCDAS
jgi:hypothetical protein